MLALLAVAKQRATATMSSSFRSQSFAACAGVTSSAMNFASSQPRARSATNASSTSPSLTITLSIASRK